MYNRPRMRFNLNGLPVFVLVMFSGLWVAAIIGYVMNIVKFVGMLDDPTITPMFVARIFGFFPLIGAVLGWF